MKTMNYIKCLIVMAFCFILTNCSNENEVNKTNVSFADMKFVVNVTDISTTKAPSDSKTGWVKGDKIIASIDKDNNNLLVITYDGENWKVEGYDNETSISNSSGSINAIYADKITVGENKKIVVFGDVLTTIEGKYELVSEDVVYINLNMNVRPVAKIRITGVPEGFWLDNIIEMTEPNISDMTWNTTKSNCEACSETEEDGSVTYYGMLDSENGNTTIILKNSEGHYYSKTFSNKIVNAGVFILIDGPLTTDDWNYFVPLNKIDVKSDINLVHGDDSKYSIYDYIEIVPTNANYDGLEFSSSDDNIATIDADGNIVGHNIGTTTINVKAKNTDIVSSVIVNVKEITDYISLSFYGTSLTMTSSGTYYGRIFRFRNNSNADVYVKTISTSNSIDVNKTVKGGEYTDIDIYLRYNVYPEVTVVYSYNNNDYSIGLKDY